MHGFRKAVRRNAAADWDDSKDIAAGRDDPPVITGTVAGQMMDDDQTDRPFSTVTINDPDFDASETIAITLNAGEGRWCTRPVRDGRMFIPFWF